MSPKTYNGPKSGDKVAPAKSAQSQKPFVFLKFRNKGEEDYAIVTRLTAVRGKKDPSKLYLIGNTIIRDNAGNPVKEGDQYVTDQEFLCDITQLVNDVASGKL